MFSKPAEPQHTQQGSQVQTPWQLTKEEFRLSALIAADMAMASVGIGLAIVASTAIPVLIVAPPVLVVTWLAWRFQRRLHRTEQAIYRDGQPRPTITDGPTVVFVRDRVQTPKGHVEKDAQPIDVGMPPAEAARALRWMKQTGKTSRREVTAGAGISQGAWAKLNDALHRLGIIDGGRLTDEIDYLLAQLDDL